MEAIGSSSSPNAPTSCTLSTSFGVVGHVGGTWRPAVRKNRMGEAKASKVEEGEVKRRVRML